MAEGLIRRLRVLRADATDYEAFVGEPMTAESLERPANRKAGMWVLWFLLRSCVESQETFDEEFLEAWPVRSRPQERLFVNLALKLLTALEKKRVLQPKSTRRSAVEAFSGEQFFALLGRLARASLVHLLPDPAPLNEWLLLNREAELPEDVQNDIDNISERTTALLSDRQTSQQAAIEAKEQLGQRLNHARMQRALVKATRSCLAQERNRFMGELDQKNLEEQRQQAHAELAGLASDIKSNQVMSQMVADLSVEKERVTKLMHIDGKRLGRKNVQFLDNNGNFDLISMLQKRTRFLEKLTVTHQRMQRASPSQNEVDLASLNDLRTRFRESIPTTKSLFQETERLRGVVAAEVQSLRENLDRAWDGEHRDLQCSPEPAPRTPGVPKVLPATPSPYPVMLVPGAGTVGRRIREAAKSCDHALIAGAEGSPVTAGPGIRRNTVTAIVRHTPVDVSDHKSNRNLSTMQKSVRFMDRLSPQVTPNFHLVHEIVGDIDQCQVWTARKRLFDTPPSSGEPVSLPGANMTRWIHAQQVFSLKHLLFRWQLSALKYDPSLPLLSNLPLADENADSGFLGALSLRSYLPETDSGSRASQPSVQLSDDDFLEVSRAANFIVAGLENS